MLKSGAKKPTGFNNYEQKLTFWHFTTEAK